MRSSRNGRLRAPMWMAPPRRSAKWRGGLASTIHRMLPQKIWCLDQLALDLIPFTVDFHPSIPRSEFSLRENGWTRLLGPRPDRLGRDNICPPLSNLYKVIWDTCLDTHLSHACAPTLVLTPSWVRQSGRIDTLIFTFNYCSTRSSHRVAHRALGNAHLTHQF